MEESNFQVKKFKLKFKLQLLSRQQNASLPTSPKTHQWHNCGDAPEIAKS